MLERIFNPENAFFRWCDRILDTVVLSLLWVFCCLPVITIGPATAALYYTVAKCLRRGEAHPYQNFFQCFRTNFKVGALSTLVCLAAAYLLQWACAILFQLTAAGDMLVPLAAACVVFLALPCAGIACYLFPALSRFTFSVGGLFSTSLRLACRHFPSTAALIVLNGVSVTLCLRWWTPVLVLPSLTMLLSSFLLERIFQKYTPEAPASEPEDRPWYLK